MRLRGRAPDFMPQTTLSQDRGGSGRPQQSTVQPAPSECGGHAEWKFFCTPSRFGLACLRSRAWPRVLAQRPAGACQVNSRLGRPGGVSEFYDAARGGDTRQHARRPPSGHAQTLLPPEAGARDKTTLRTVGMVLTHTMSRITMHPFVQKTSFLFAEIQM